MVASSAASGQLESLMLLPLLVIGDHSSSTGCGFVPR